MFREESSGQRVARYEVMRFGKVWLSYVCCVDALMAGGLVLPWRWGAQAPGFHFTAAVSMPSDSRGPSTGRFHTRIQL
jgi:hypothetical protein